MKQPELGAKITELRNQKGITQKELADSCSIDIRTVQRIESGDVEPRTTTLKLISQMLDFDFYGMNHEQANDNNTEISKLILVAFISGLIHYASWIFYSPIFFGNSIAAKLGILLPIIYLITGIVFFLGFYELGKKYHSTILKTAVIITFILLPLFFISSLLTDFHHAVHYLVQLLVTLSGINSILLGTGLIKITQSHKVYYNISGLLQIVSGPFFIIPIGITNIIGCWISFVYVPFMLVILYLEYKDN